MARPCKHCNVCAVVCRPLISDFAPSGRRNIRNPVFSKYHTTSVDEGLYLLDQRQLKEDRERRHAHLEEVQARLNDCLKKIERKNVDALTYAARRARKKLFTMDQREIRTKINMNELEIGRLHEMRHGLFEYDLGRVMAEVQDELVDKAGIPRVLTPDSIAADDCWTSIRFEVASRYSCDPNTTGALGFTVDTSANHGLLCAAVNTSHNESYINAMRQMVNASVQISFDCMRVDIARPWLRKELFYDSDLRVPEGD